MDKSIYRKYALASALGGLGIIIVGAMVVFGVQQKPKEVACTEEAQICPDGTAVGRSGPLCTFAKCPKVQVSTSTNADTVVLPPVEPSGCTKEAKVCPDGSTVGRVAPSCDFASCPLTKISDPDKESGTITGTVMVGPTCPVVRMPPDPNCADKPMKVDLVVMTKDQKQVLQTFTTKDDGTFSLHFPVGSYVIVQNTNAPLFPRCTQSEIFTVVARSSVNIPITCDTGIR